MKARRQNYGGYDSETPSSHLWVGNLPGDISESDLSELFGKHGSIDGITCYASRTYAFVYFKRVEDATAAKDALQGFPLKGSSIKIEFAKPAKPSKHVWVGGFGSSVTKEKLEEELSKFGKIEEFKFLRDRNTALVDFVRVEDASAAVKDLSCFQIGGDRIRVDFLRSHPGRRELSDFHDMGSAQFRGRGGMDPSWANPDMRNYPDSTYSGQKRPHSQPSQSFGGRKGGQPSKVLWVGYPPSVVIDEEMLHNAMILYGEIERIKSFPARHYSFVEFRSMEEARRAKDALQGRLFNDPRITITFSNSDLAPGKDFGPPFPGYRGQVPDMFGNEAPFRPPPMDMFPANRGIAPSSFPGPQAPSGPHGPGVPRPFGPRGNLDPLLPPPDFNDPLSDLNANAPLGLNRRKLSPPATGLLPTPGVPGRTSHKTSGWDVLDPNQLPRESKRSRIDGPTSFSDPPFVTGKGDEYIAGGDQPYVADPQFYGGPIPRVHVDSRLSSAEMGAAQGLGHPDDDFIWRGLIAKGGTPVCHARCIPIGKGLERELPGVVNCSARTGLDMLKKHYAGATGTEIVFFLPDSEDDFANYTEFLRYLGSKNRAGVAKLDDGTTLFLVPPSDFLTDVLKVTGPERLYGVVLRMPQQTPGGPPAHQPVHQHLPPVPHMENQLAPPPHEYVHPPPKNEPPVQMDYGRAAPIETTLPSKAPFPTGSAPQDQSNDNIPSSRPGVTLTPELIATLASFLPSSGQKTIAQNAQPQMSNSAAVHPPPAPTTDKGTFVHGWSQQPQVLDQTGQSSQLYPNAQSSTTYQPLAPNLNTSGNPVPFFPGSMAMQNPVYNHHEQGSVSSRAPNTHSAAVQSQQFVPPSQGNQPYPLQAPHNTQKGYGMAHGMPSGSYTGADIQQPKPPVSYSTQFQGAAFSRPEHVLPSPSGNMNMEPLNQAERPQSMPSGVGQSPVGSQAVPSGVGQGTTEVEVDKNQRYQSTLQFAANLLLQIQQQQQQQHASSQMGNKQ